MTNAAGVPSAGRIVEGGPGSSIATLWIRNHQAAVRIGYDDSQYWIEYLGSENLDYTTQGIPLPRGRVMKGPRIHPNYNLWVRSLAKAIEIRAKNTLRAVASDKVSAEQRLFIADELEKLDALRERGVLTQEEFDQRKVKLLAQ